jgi:hypothetical protein
LIAEWRAGLNNFITILELAQKSNTRQYLGSFLEAEASYSAWGGA